MKYQVLLLLSAVLGFSCQSQDDDCFKSLNQASEVPECDLRPLKQIKKNFESIFDEVYGNLPVNRTCIGHESSRGEVALAFQMLQTPEDASNRETFQQLLTVILKKILTCYDHDELIRKLLKIYDALHSVEMKRCIMKFANENFPGEECEAMRDEVSATFEIDEIFFESLAAIGTSFPKQRSSANCMESENGNPEKLKATMKLVSSQASALSSRDKASDRENFRKFYFASLEHSLNCLQHKADATINVFDLFRISHFVLSTVLAFLLVFLALICVLVFHRETKGREKYLYVRIEGKNATKTDLKS